MSDFLVVHDLCKSYRSGTERLDVLIGLSLLLDEGTDDRHHGSIRLG